MTQQIDYESRILQLEEKTMAMEKLINKLKMYIDHEVTEDQDWIAAYIKRNDEFRELWNNQA